MAGDWIKMETCLMRKAKFLRMRDLLKISRYTLIGHLHALWAWADENSIDGTNVPVTRATIDEVSGLEGLSAALGVVGWLVGDDYSLTFPDFLEHNGQSAKARAVNAKHQAERRAKSKADTQKKILPATQREEKPKTPEIVLERGCPDTIVPQSTLEEREAVQHVSEAWAAYNQNRPSHMRLPAAWLRRDNANNIYATLAAQGMAFIKLLTPKVFSDAKHWADQRKHIWGWGTICNYLQDTAFTSSNAGKPAAKPAAVVDAAQEENRRRDSAWSKLTLEERGEWIEKERAAHPDRPAAGRSMWAKFTWWAEQGKDSQCLQTQT